MRRNLTTETLQEMAAKMYKKRKTGRSAALILGFSLCLCVSAVSFSCSALKPTDMSSLAPADSLVYLETNDLAAALQPLVDSKPFTEAAKYKPDLSPLKGVQVAVAVTGFETSEEKLTDENSVGRIQPHFVAIADTHAWNFQAVKFAEQKLGGFVARIYDSEPTLEKSDKDGGKYFTWTAQDGRKAFALVIDSVIYFGNDDSAIDKALAVRRGEADSIIKTGKVQPADSQTLARGYVSTDGVAQIANILALKLAADASDESEVQSAIASIVPQLLRSTITDVSWTATRSEQGYEDRWQINMPPDLANVFDETMAAGKADETLLSYVPSTASTVSLYNLKDPSVGLRSAVFYAKEKGGPLASQIIDEVLKAVFENYGLADGDSFLRTVGPTLVTAKSDDGERVLVIAQAPNGAELEKSLSPNLKPDAMIKPAEGQAGIMTWKSDDGDLSACLTGTVLLMGDPELVSAGQSTRANPFKLAKPLSDDNAVVTAGRDTDETAVVAETIGERRTQAVANYNTETRFTKTGIERETTSDLGFIGWIIAQLNEE